MTWTKSKGSVASMCSRGSGMALYAKSSDERFHVWVRRWRTGERGKRVYHYLFSVVDRLTPSNGMSYTDVVVGPHNATTTYDPAKALASAEAHAAAHPVAS